MAIEVFASAPGAPRMQRVAVVAPPELPAKLLELADEGLDVRLIEDDWDVRAPTLAEIAAARQLAEGR